MNKRRLEQNYVGDVEDQEDDGEDYTNDDYGDI